MADHHLQIYLAIAVSASAGNTKNTFAILTASLPLIHKCEVETGHLTLFNVVSLVLTFSPETTKAHMLELLLDYFNQCTKFSRIANEDTFEVDVSLDSVLKDVHTGDFIYTGTRSLEARFSIVQHHVQEVCAQFHWLDSDMCHNLMMGDSDSFKGASFQIARSVMFKTNHFGLSPEPHQAVLSRMKDLEYEPFDVWYNNFYSPITEISKTICLPTFIRWEKMSSYEKISILLSQGSPKKALPFAARLLQDNVVAWQDFNQWLLQFAKKNIPGSYISVQSILFDLVESDIFLEGLRKDTVQFHRFVSTVLCILYASPVATSSSTDEMIRLVNALEDTSETSDRVDNISILPQIPVDLTQPTRACLNKLKSRIYDSEMLGKPVLEVYELSQSSADAQYNEMIKFVARERPNWDSIVAFLHNKQTCLFRLSSPSKDSFLLSTLLDKPEEIDFLPVVERENSLTAKEIETIILEKCWQSYLGNNNLNRMVNVYPLVDLLERKKCKDAIQIRSLLNAASELSTNFKLSLSKESLFTPRRLYETRDKWIIVQKVLDTNAKAYLERKRLFSVLILLGVGFNDGESVHPQADLKNPVYVKLLVMCIQSALRDDNFTFAYEHSMRLLDSHDTDDVISQNWVVFFRVGQYLTESKTAVSLIEKQLALLSKLLLVVPPTFNRQVMDQWCLLEVELSTRAD